MILVGIADNAHDSNISAWINGRFRYAKYERESGIKHGRAPAIWFWKKLEEWGVEEKDIDAFAYVEPHMYYYSEHGYMRHDPAPFYGEAFLTKYNVTNGWNGMCKHLPDDHYFLLDHHYAHFFSNTTMTSGDKAVISDTGGSNNHKTLIIGTDSAEFVRPNRDVDSSGKLLYKLGQKMGLTGEESDVIGKIMGLQAFGKIDEYLVREWTNRGRSDAGYLYQYIDNLNIDPSPDNTYWLGKVASIFEIGRNYQKEMFDVLGPQDNKIYYSGGIALNVNWNRYIKDSGYDLVIEPHVYDGGLSIGCVRFLAEQFGQQIEIDNFPYIQDDESPKQQPKDSLIKEVAEMLAEGKIIGWYQGQGELGPRALGNRSILMNPTIKNGKDILNQKVKRREWWRPFGASVKQDKASEYFDMEYSPYMLYTSKVLDDRLSSVTHVDGTCRHQTVNENQNNLYYRLLDEFEKLTGFPVLLNTSLNIGGKPIAGKIEDAVELLRRSDMDALCAGDDLYTKG